MAWPGPASVPLVWFGLDQNVIVNLETQRDDYHQNLVHTLESQTGDGSCVNGSIQLATCEVLMNNALILDTTRILECPKNTFTLTCIYMLINTYSLAYIRVVVGPRNER